MVRWRWLVCAVVALTFGMGSRGRACDDEPAQVGAAAMPEAAPALDAVSPSIVPAYVQALFERWRNAFAPATDATEEMRDRTIPLGLVRQATY